MDNTKGSQIEGGGGDGWGGQKWWVEMETIVLK